MSNGQPPRVRIEDVAPTLAPLGPAPRVVIDTLDGTSLAQPEPTRPDPVAPPAPRRGWLGWCLGAGILGIALVGTVDWALGLLDRLPILGVPAALAVSALLLGVAGLVVREVRALRRLRDVEDLRAAWQGADGTRLRHLILRIGTELGAPAAARAAADVVEDAGPVAARRLVSRDILAPRDRRVAEAVAAAARQGFVLVTASPSPALDSLLLLLRALRLLRDIAMLYGYRPGALALRSLVLSAGRDAGAVALADALAQAAAQSASRSIADAGDAAAAAGAAAGATGVGAIVAIPLAAAGLTLSVLGRTVATTGGAIGGGGAAAWRLYRFGLMALVAARPLPFDGDELAALKQQMRDEILRLRAAEATPPQPPG
ncbi:DUF697 domain-containing protein [Humitalea sp. 24SJ18S-53]|uniref:DUF697 domain-containing protein n=1 Tax=Humitalea sp. 24SJ18S-53 TaxID=3422307 RepID=UPI003D664DC6